ncbi:MAG: MBL fold metallo-hydrolase [Oscillospiraceae bacterium]|nr:MBL fold metallo-hydrolase [Oscillospiraceae bacterium]
MKIAVFASGSGGNCMLLSHKDSHILIDAGISMRRIETSLRSQGLTVNDIGGVLITHEHSDHISGLKMLLKHHGVEVFAPRTVAARLRGMLPEIEDHLTVLPVGIEFKLGEFTVRAFHTPHDTDESVGYRIEGGGSFALATDMGCVTDEVLSGLLGANTVLIESNHDVAMLCDGPYPVQLKRRILSNHGHLSNVDCARLVRHLADRGTRRVILGHLSKENNRPGIAMAENGHALMGSGAELFCAPVFGCLELETEEDLQCLL